MNGDTTALFFIIRVLLVEFKLQVNDILLKQRSRLLPFSEEGQDIRRCVPVKVVKDFFFYVYPGNGLFTWLGTAPPSGHHVQLPELSPRGFASGDLLVFKGLMFITVSFLFNTLLNATYYMSVKGGGSGERASSLVLSSSGLHRGDWPSPLWVAFLVSPLSIFCGQGT